MKSRRRTAKQIIKYMLITVAAVLLFIWGQQAAYAQRGYAAAGGEYLLLLLPLIWYAAERTVREFAQALKSMRKEETGYEVQEHRANMHKEQDRSFMRSL